MRHAALAQPAEVAERIFTARQDHHIHARQLLRLANIADADVRLRRQRVEIGKIGDVRHLNHGNLNIAPVGAQIFPFLQRDAVLIFKIDVQPRHDAEHRDAGERFYLLDPGIQQRHVAAKFINNHALDPRALAIVQQRERAVDRGEYAAAIDIRHEDHRALGHLGHAHIDDVAIAQIDLRRTSCPFQHQHIMFGGQAVINREDLFPQARFIFVIAHRVHIGRHLAHQHHLRFAVAGWLKQHRVHAHIRDNTRRFGLENLRAAHLFAIRRDTGIKRHILRFKRRGALPVLIKDAAQPRDQHAFADVRSGAL